MKQKLKKGKVLFGPWCVIPSSPLINIIANTGVDFVIIDMEHSVISFETAEEMVRAAHSEGINTIIRQGTINEESILKSLDMGSDGILIAHVENAKDAQEVVALSKYYPKGRRGFSPYTRAGKYSGGKNITDHARNQNEDTIVGVILEGSKGIENIDKILEVEDIDLVYIGAYDLSQALRIPGDVNNSIIKKYMEECVVKIKQKGIAPGGFVAKNKEDMCWMVDIGMQFITYLPDCTAIHGVFTSAVDDFKSVLKRKG